MNKVLKVTIILILILTMFAQVSVTFAAQVEGTESSGGAGTSEWNKGKTNWGDIFTTGNDFIKKGSDAQSTIDEEQLRTETSSIFKILSTIGVVLSVIIGGILGIKFMMGSVEEKAQYKEHMKPYIIGISLVFCISAILRVIASLIKSSISSSFISI